MNLYKDDKEKKIKVEDMIVNIKYSDNNKKLDECILNILNKKNQID